MSSTSKKRVSLIRAFVKDSSVDGAAEHFGLARETIRRYMRADGEREEVTPEKDIVSDVALLKTISERYSKKELKLLAGGSIQLENKHTAVHDFSGDKIKVGWFGDTHIGSIYTNDDYIKDAREMFASEGVDMVVHTGDVTEGASNRPGHVYECSEYGYEAQKEKAIELLAPFDFCPMYVIDGNHDRWYIKSCGAIIVKDICKELPYAQFLGHDEGDIVLNDKAYIKLWHGEDGSSYAHSYRIQKLIESWQGGTKPAVLYTGHVHKYVTMLERNIQCVSTGSIQKQSKWMRSKRLPAHTGFGISKITLNEKGIGRFGNTFFPFYA